MARRKLRSAASRRSRSARNKGASGEREFAALLSAALKFGVQRKLGASRDGGDDVVLHRHDFPASLINKGFSFEVKRRQSINIVEFMRQAVENGAAIPDRIPVVAFRRNNMPWLACLTLDDFFKLLRCALNIAE